MSLATQYINEVIYGLTGGIITGDEPVPGSDYLQDKEGVYDERSVKHLLSQVRKIGSVQLPKPSEYQPERMKHFIKFGGVPIEKLSYSTKAVPVKGKQLKDFDINKEFDYLNKYLFDKQVLKPPYFKWTRLKTATGQVIVRVRRDHQKRYLETNVLYLQITNMYDLSKEHFRAVLAHEMIHVLMHQKKEVKSRADVHGWKFSAYARKANEIIKQRNLAIGQITLTDSIASTFPYVETGKEKPLEFVHVKVYNKEEIGNIYKSQKLSKNLMQTEDWLYRIGRWYEPDIHFTVYETTHPELYKYKTSTKLKNFGIFNFTQSEIREIVANSKAIYTYVSDWSEKDEDAKYYDNLKEW
jgi:predicted SprT family Zn-dependent metalloprotease